ncbi:MAG: hypothetical protein EOO14_22575, partial [Chitinophagaceae bacterium]
MKEKDDQHNKQVEVPFLAAGGSVESKAAAHLLHGCQKHSLAHAPWFGTYPATPVVQFAIAYGENGIYLQYDVEEDFIRAENGRVNDPVYQDSCVEFFISLDGGDTYYNFEFNSIGTVLA